MQAPADVSERAVALPGQLLHVIRWPRNTRAKYCAHKAAQKRAQNILLFFPRSEKSGNHFVLPSDATSSTAAIGGPLPKVNLFVTAMKAFDGQEDGDKRDGKKSATESKSRAFRYFQARTNESTAARPFQEFAMHTTFSGPSVSVVVQCSGH